MRLNAFKEYNSAHAVRYTFMQILLLIHWLFLEEIDVYSIFYK